MVKDVKTLLNSIQENLFPDIKVALRTYQSSEKDFWSKWVMWKNWDKKELPNYRQIIPNELVFETDFPTRKENEEFALKIIQKLKDGGYPYNAVFTGNKSVHVHTFFSKNCDVDRVDKKKLALRILGPEIYNTTEFDKINLERTRMIQIESARNPKTGALPEIMDSCIGTDIVVIDSDYKETGDFIKHNSEIIIGKNSKMIDNGSPNPCLFLEYAAENMLPPGNRHGNVDPNFAAYATAFPEKKELFFKYYKTQQKPVITTWVNADAQFNCSQLCRYAQSLGITEPCETCKKYKLYSTSRKVFFMEKTKLKRKNLELTQTKGL